MTATPTWRSLQLTESLEGLRDYRRALLRLLAPGHHLPETVFHLAYWLETQLFLAIIETQSHSTKTINLRYR